MVKAVSALLWLLPATAFAQSAPPPPANAPSDAPPAAAPAAAAAAAPAAAPAAAAAPAPAPAAASASAAAAAPAPASVADLDPTQGHTLDETGYLLRAKTAELGLFYFGYGITDWLNVGTFPELWVIGPLLGGFIGNASVKVGAPVAPWAHVSFEASPTYLYINDAGSKSHALVLPLTVAGSFRAGPGHAYSLAARYIHVAGNNESDTASQDVEGAVLTSMVQVIADARYPLSQTISLYARGYFQPWERYTDVDGSTQLDPQTSVDLQAQSTIYTSRPWAALLGVHFRWNTINLRVGGGYGNFFLPRLGIPLKNQGFVPDLDFYVRF